MGVHKARNLRGFSPPLLTSEDPENPEIELLG